MIHFLQLPDLLILEVFSHLNVKEICIISRVCKRWNKIAKDKSLWRRIDMTDARINLKKAWKFYRSRLSDCLQKLCMRGYYSPGDAVKQKKAVLSDALLEDIHTSCPNIEEIVLEKFYLGSISSSKLPSSLVCLRLSHCQWPIGWMKGAELPNLRSLYVDHCSRIDNGELKEFFKLSSVELLHLGHLYRVKTEGIQGLTESMTQLKNLTLCNMNVDDLAVHHICRNLKQLNRLTVTECELSDAAVDNMFVSLKELRVLDISKNKNLTGEIIALSAKSKGLQKLVYRLDPKLINKDALDCIENRFPGRCCNTFVSEYNCPLPVKPEGT
ncbi:F-box/LRR-repeat protein 12-like [Dreissena polymorpha]|uniref:F-box domain-containing protein n=1 Tax=Dreissena polymorpha TaxID=45954 RepID=A0A9D4CBP1_DREPO|nr:F-box/LRR-repeat protein 12-like [Dreissena polymorpha]KAH3721181.1 hypothetical protein DPMN_064100 [Dreissena polymorpha]